MRTVLGALAALSLFPTLVLAGMGSGPRKPHVEEEEAPAYVMHEWGTFTSVAGADGAPVEWRPTLDRAALPSFVHTAPALARADFDPKTTVRMETPVVYFYAKNPLTVSARVDFPGGMLTEWYPYAEQEKPSSLSWPDVRISPESAANFPTEPMGSEYFAARETDAAPIMVASGQRTPQWERFLFYRGIGSPAIPLRVTRGTSTGEVAIAVGDRGGDGAIPQAILVSNDGSTLRARTLGALRSGTTTTAGSGDALSQEALEKELLRVLVSQGLYEKEAKAMIATWRGQWFERGTRLFYVMPRSQVDEVLPMTLSPKPKKRVRVIVGRIELLDKSETPAPRFKEEWERRFAKTARWIEPPVRPHNR